MKKILFILVLILLVIYITANLKVFGQEESRCPEGTYDIGISKTDEPLCKIKPTGCPKGDSIPMIQCNEIDENTMSYNIEPTEVLDEVGK